MSQTTTALIGAVLGIGTAATALGARAWPVRRPAAPAHDAAPAVPVVWLACHSTRCAHLTTRHTRNPDGTATCTGCGNQNPGGTR